MRRISRLTCAFTPETISDQRIQCPLVAASVGWFPVVPRAEVTRGGPQVAGVIERARSRQRLSQPLARHLSNRRRATRTISAIEGTGQPLRPMSPQTVRGRTREVFRREPVRRPERGSGRPWRRSRRRPSYGQQRRVPATRGHLRRRASGAGERPQIGLTNPSRQSSDTSTTSATDPHALTRSCGHDRRMAARRARRLISNSPGAAWAYVGVREGCGGDTAAGGR